MAIRSRCSARSASASTLSVKMATAPRVTASAAKLLPTCREPGKAPTRKPGCTSRESAVRPRISGSFDPVNAGTEASSSVSFKLFTLQALDRHCPLDLGSGFVDRLHPEERRDALNYTAGGRRHGPACGGVAVALLVRVRFVDHRQDKIFGVVDRKGRDKTGEQLSVFVVSARNLVPRPGLPADHVSRSRGLRPRPVFNHQSHQLAHLFRGFRRNYLLTLRRIIGWLLDERGLAENPAIDERCGRAGKAQRSHGDPVAEGNRHHVDVAPFPREMRCPDLRYLDLRSLQQADPAEKLPLPLSARGHSHLRCTDI